MRLSTSTNIMCFDQGVNYCISMEDSVRACAEAGYKCLDASLYDSCRKGQPLTFDNWETWAHKARENADKLGIRYSQAHAYFPIGESNNDNMDTRTDDIFGEEMMRRSVLTAEILGVEWMVVHPLTLSNETGCSYKKSFQYNKEYYSKWGDFFAQHNVGMAIENMSLFDGKIRYGCTPDELLELVEAINNPMVGICVDTGHANLAKLNTANFIRAVGPNLRATHIADNHENEDEHFAPYNGTIDWPDVIKALKEINYKGDFSFEIHHLTSMYPKEVQQELVKFSYALGNYLVNLV